jgi:polysaccharide export outer membrane protein
MYFRKIRIWHLALTASAAILAGCATSGGGGVSTKALPYQPDGDGRDVWSWQDGAGAGTASVHMLSATNGLARALRKGDKVRISLTGIPEPMEIENVVNDFGFVTLPLVGQIEIEGITTAKAELLIRDTYIQKQFYKSIDVIVVAQEGEFYVRGEVKKEGVFPISGDVTLMQGIIMAGGYTDFARKSDVKLIRGRDTTLYDVEKIEKRKAEDPVIRTGDIIVVERRVFF